MGYNEYYHGQRVNGHRYLPGDGVTIQNGMISARLSGEGGNAAEIREHGIFVRDLAAVPEMHRMIFRGKHLGTALTGAQLAAIEAGTFDDLFTGDYWVINGITWRIVDIDYWLHCGDTAFETHHLVIMPDTNLGENKKMNDTATTGGGYVGSLMYTTNMDDARALCTGAFGANILTHREYLVNAVASGKASGSVWLDSSIELPTETMVYGCKYYSTTNASIDKTQLALFALAPRFAVSGNDNSRKNYWLRDVVSSAIFAAVDTYGRVSCNNANSSYYGIRPVFPIGAA